MATIHTSPPNMVPAIPSGALPQTPVSEWAESMTDLLSGHVTRTPVGTPGPHVPGEFPSHLEPDSEAVSNTTGNADADAGAKERGATFLETAQATLAAATAYLPPGLASYLPSSPSKASASPSESSLPPLPPSSASSGSTLPKDTPSTIGRLDSAATADSAALSTTVHTGHSSSAIPPAAIAKPPRPTSGLIASHPGVAADPPQLVQSPASMSVKSLPSPAPPQPTEGMKPSHPGVSSPPASTPASNASATASASSTPTPPKPTEGMKPSHPGVDASRVPAPSSYSSPAPPKPTEGMKPSHPGVDAARGDVEPAPNVHTLHLPTHRVFRGHPHPTPHAPPTAVSASSPRNDVNANLDVSQTSSILAASTPSLVPSAADSGYAASTESGTPPLATPTEGEAQMTPIPPPMHIPPGMAGTVADVVARADAGGSPRLTDDVLEPSALSPVRAPDVNSSSPLSPLRRSDVVSSISSLGSGVQAPTSSPRMPDSARVPTGDSGAEGDVDEPSSPAHSRDSSSQGEADNGGDHGGGKKTKRASKLLQKLKEKMHVGGGSS
ncbi:hypothetical protein MSAN_01634300 [Mycena sanguinolenta]|uniref:Uncharacterized protein n=1 Tax=Mycena sanguinolenta TaxID=230812 RepID=A0A8H6Y114_9AGAR|nr:hypothetical protein MSAN_01634300 [Mycena sanguinolenta]